MQFWRKSYEEFWMPHLWFAWYPVKVHTYPDGGSRYVWLEKVIKTRCSDWDGWTNEYKEINKQRKAVRK